MKISELDSDMIYYLMVPKGVDKSYYENVAIYLRDLTIRINEVNWRGSNSFFYGGQYSKN